ncbi:MAG: hypothetical protein K2O65_02165 [Lachnospiraceae bacterium]|nr:hypothetical protein [Lachnospiraceae bacterium]
MSSAVSRVRSGVVLAHKQLFARLTIRQQPASEMKRSGIELRHCGVDT